MDGHHSPYLANTLLTRFPNLPYASEYAVPTNVAPAIVLPSVTGIKLLKTNSDVVMSAPSIMPHGIMNMLATQCSSPMVTKAEMGSQTAIALPPRVLAAFACQTAMHTNQLQSMPLATACHTRPDTSTQLHSLMHLLLLLAQAAGGALGHRCLLASRAVKSYTLLGIGLLAQSSAWNDHGQAGAGPSRGRAKQGQGQAGAGPSRGRVKRGQGPGLKAVF